MRWPRVLAAHDDPWRLVSAVRRDGEVTTYETPDGFVQPPRVERVAYVADDGSLATGFEVTTWTTADNQLDVALVGADGAVREVRHLTSNDRYRGFREDPLKDDERARVLVGLMRAAARLLAANENRERILTLREPLSPAAEGTLARPWCARIRGGGRRAGVHRVTRVEPGGRVSFA